MSYYKLKKAILRDGEIVLTVADSSIRPLSYYSTTYGDKSRSLDVRMLDLFIDILSGNFHPTEKCSFLGLNLRDADRAIHDASIKYAPDISYEKDRLYDLKEAEALFTILGWIELNWVKRASPSLTLLDSEKVLLRSCNDIAARRYEKAAENLKKKGIILVRAAARSPFFKDLICLFTEDERMCLGFRDKYDNHGRYDNSTNSVIYLSGGGEDPTALFYFFSGNPMVACGLPKIDWSKICHITGCDEARNHYKELAKAVSP